MKWVEWQHRRSRLNHDWLKNWLMPALSKLLRVSDGQIADPQYFGDFSRTLRREWPESASEVLALVEAFPHAMSPASYFNEEPLSRLPADDAVWMQEVAHELWLRSFPVDDLTQEIVGALRAANESYNALSLALEQDEQPSNMVDIIEGFQLSCKALGDAVSKLPSKPEFKRRCHD